MPIYLYGCANCKAKKEVLHEMKYVGDESNLPKEIKDEVSCNVKTCKNSSHKCSFQGMIWNRIPQEPTIVTNGVQTLKQKQEQRKTRSRAHFKNEVLPTVTDKASKRAFEKKYKNTKKIDHTKM